ncbi:MAG: hypothetical protein FJY67_11020 [Calditrichaeota bacterium]|nr:hypothetical protein [Calditrichota bacterium]
MKDLVLRNLWHYQRRHFGTTDFKQRWTFTLTEEHPLFPYFAGAILSLKREGLVDEDGDNGQFFLTAKGIAHCEQENLELEFEDRFFQDFGI